MYQINYTKKVAVNIFKDLPAYHIALKAMYVDVDLNDWTIGNAKNSVTIFIVSPENPGPLNSYDTIVKAAVHEFIHCATFKIIGTDSSLGRPDWLDEGFAVLEAEQLLPDNKFKEMLKQMTVIPDIATLESSFNQLSESYELSGRAVDFLIKTYRKNKFVELLKTPQNF